MSLSGTFANPALWTLYREGEDAMFVALKKPCRLYYAPSLVTSTAPSQPIGQLPGFIDVHGGHIPPYSQGQPTSAEGYRETENSETIYMQVNWNMRTFTSIYSKIVAQSPGDTFCQTKFLKSDFPKIMKCESAILNTLLENQVKYEFVRNAEPIPNGMQQDAYYLCLWKRVG
jgi:hypothetical protein